MSLTQLKIGQDFSTLLDDLKAATGVLAFQTKAGKFCLHLRDSIVQAVFVNGRPLRDREQAEHLLALQLGDSPTEYRFEEALPEDLRKGLSISVCKLLAEAPDNCGYHNKPEEPEQQNSKGFWQRMFGQSADDSALS